MLRGLSTVRYHAADLEAATRWYTEFLGIEPYFARPGYCEFRIGDYQHELGLMDARFLGAIGGAGAIGGDGGLGPAEEAGSPPPRAGGAVVYWHVDDLTATVEALIELGATEREPIREFGEGFAGACVADPFGNLLGVMSNAHYLEVLAARS